MQDIDRYRNLTIAEARERINVNLHQAGTLIESLPLHTATRQRLRREYGIPTPPRKGHIPESSKIGYIRGKIGHLPPEQRAQAIRDGGLHHEERDRLRQYFGLKGIGKS